MWVDLMKKCWVPNPENRPIAGYIYYPSEKERKILEIAEPKHKNRKYGPEDMAVSTNLIRARGFAGARVEARPV